MFFEGANYLRMDCTEAYHVET